MSVKYPLYFTEILLGGQLPHMPWPWPVNLLSPKRKKRKLMYKLVRPSPERTVVQHNGSRNPNESKPKTSVTLTL